MRAVIQRVTNCEVQIDQKNHSGIDHGLFVLLGIMDDDNEQDIRWLAKKIVQLRIFNDENGVMNLSVLDKGYAIMLVSQFTLYASTKKGNRPSYIKASKPEIAIPLYERFIVELKKYEIQVETGVFGADMKIRFTNDGPVSLIIDTKQRE